LVSTFFSDLQKHLGSQSQQRKYEIKKYFGLIPLMSRDIMKEESNRLWWAENGRAILSQLLVKSDKDPQVQK
jgi:hypothetical protein